MTTRNIYGLLVGIDKYFNPRHNLNGCVNDVEAFQTYLEERLDMGEFAPPRLRVLKNEQATREAVIQGFREHLNEARAGDVALFYYAGHGAQERAPEQFWHLEPDRLDETLVLYDSRAPDGWDLADKELSQLILEVYEASEGKAHILTILDCCHSGSGTRDARDEGASETKVRRLETDTRLRPLSSFILDEATLARLTRDLNTAEHTSVVTLPEGKHVLLAACQSRQLAKEYRADDRHQGAFSYFLRQTLEASSHPLSYRELLARTRVRVENSVQDQTPLVEANDASDLDRPFLGGAVGERSAYLVFNRGGAWVMDAGAVHGVREGGTRLALFDVDADQAAPRDLDRAVAEAEVERVLPQESRLTILDGDALDLNRQFKAVITATPVPSLSVRLEGDPLGVELAREAVAKSGPGGRASLYLREAGDGETAAYRLKAEGGRYLIARPADDRPLVDPVDGWTEEGAARVIAQLEHIARWHDVADLENPGSSIPPGAVKLVLHHDGEAVENGDVTLRYREEGGQQKRPTFRLQLVNTSTETYHCAVVALFESYAVEPGLFPTGSVELPPGSDTWALRGGEIPASVPDALWQQGVTERRDIVKLIVSTNEFDARLLQQPALDAPLPPTTRSAGDMDTRGGSGSALNRLMARVRTRDFDFGEVKTLNDWTTLTVATRVVRPRGEVTAADGGVLSPAERGIGVRLEPHPSLRAQARLTTLTETSRDLSRGGLGDQLVPDILGEDPSVSVPLSFTTSRGQDPGLRALELSGIENPEAVTAQEPLALTLDVELAEGEHLLPYAFDGEFYLPLGRAERQATRGDTSGTRVVLERLPDTDVLKERSLTGSIRILFQKIASRVFPSVYRYPLLAVAEVDDDANVSYETDATKVKEAVGGAERVLLFIHGIIGDTKGLAASVQLASVERNGERVPLKRAYDVVLAFDYENLQTPIEETAAALKSRLEAAGLGAGHAKTLDLVAHSMGGLVSRTFIERLGGHEMVSHLVMVGTPNGGSPWSRVEDWATTALALGLNRLSAVFWPASLLGGLVALLEKVDVALDEMNENSSFIKGLAENPDPGIPYTVLAGDTSIIAPAGDGAGEAAQGAVRRLLEKLNLKGRAYEALSTLLFKETNDIAVAVASIKALPEGRTPAPAMDDVASDHMSYFFTEAGLEKLVWALERRS